MSLILVDGSSYLFRAFHALPSLTTSRGEPTGAILGVAQMLRKLMAEHASDQVVVVFDAPGRTFRDDLDPAYKANRPAAPNDLIVQIKTLHALIRAMGLPIVMIEGVEADDVIATLATEARQKEITTVIVTGDKDLAQLVDDHITLLDTMKNVKTDRAEVIAKFGVPPERMVDYLTLVGDSVDNVPGVPGVGPKTAARWITEYGSLNELIQRANEIKGKAGESLRTALPQLPMTRALVTLRNNVALPVVLADLETTPPNQAALKELLTRLEFRTWLAELLKVTEQDDEIQKTEVPHYQLISTWEELDECIQRLTAAELFTIDIITSDPEKTDSSCVGLCFSTEPGNAAYIPLGHRTPLDTIQLDTREVLARLKPLLEDPHHAKLGHDLKHEMRILANHGIKLAGIQHDSMLESYVLDSTASQHDPNSLSLKFLGERPIHYDDVTGKGVKRISFDRVSVQRAAEYTAGGADITWHLHQHFLPKLQNTERLYTLYETMEMPLVSVLARMEQCGILVDRELLRVHSEELAVRLGELEEQCHQLAGEAFNLSSPKQIQEIFFTRMKLPVLERTPTGQPSCDKAVLEQLAVNYELPRLLLVHRELVKLRSTYTERLPEQINPHTGRIHASFHQAVAATGRLSASDPNLQNIPVRTPEGRRIRAAFIAAPGCQLLSADYSQIELRIMAHLSQDAGLVSAFADGRDIHRATAAEVFGVPLARVTDEQRRSAKAINFGLLYGMSAFGLAKQLGIDNNSAQRYMDLYFARYSGVRNFIDETRRKAREDGFVETVFGRRLYLPDIHSRNRQHREYAERTAINAPMQGTAADIIKRAMIHVDTWLEDSALPARMVLQVHDELIFEVRADNIPVVSNAVREIMTNAGQLAVPLEISIGVGKNWDDAH